MTDQIAFRNRRKLIGSVYKVVLSGRQHGLSMDLLVNWGKDVAKALGGEGKAPTWLARDANFLLLSYWLSSFLHAIEEKEAILVSNGRLLPHWTIVGFKTEIRTQRYRWSQQLMKKITAVVQAGEAAGAGRYLMGQWEKRMKERFCMSDEVFSDSGEDQGETLNSSIRNYRDLYKVSSALSSLLVEIEEKYETGGKKAVIKLVTSNRFKAEEIYRRLFPQPVDPAENLASLASLRMSPPPSPPMPKSPLSEFTVLGRDQV
ncbi:hypothetical protein JCM5353_001004 [Sporobolomyces roseus]